jgi:hypothetical protein
MNASTLLFVLIFVIVGGACFLLAYLIGVRRMVHLIAGYDARTVADEAGLARLTARGLVLTGLLTVLLPAALLMWPAAFPLVFGGYLAAVLGVAAFMAARSGRYLRRSRAGRPSR